MSARHSVALVAKGITLGRLGTPCPEKNGRERDHRLEVHRP